MQPILPSYLTALRAADLEPRVAQALDTQHLTVLDWQIQRFGGSAADFNEGALGIYRLVGTAQVAKAVVPWSLVIKGSAPLSEPGADDPAHPFYWRREPLLYQSGALAQLPGKLIAPRCFAVEETTAGYWLWLEDIKETEDEWALESYCRAAHHLGHFNGAYLVTHKLPERYPWLASSRVCEELVQLQVEPPSEFDATPLGHRFVRISHLDRVNEFLTRRSDLLQAIERLPAPFCHLDPFRRNLLTRHRAGVDETVAIDWSYSGMGMLGEDPGLLARISLTWLEVPATQANTFISAIYEHYLAGLHEAGWHGDLRLVRVGYTLTLALGMRWPLQLMQIFKEAKYIAIMERIIGHSMDVQLEQLALLQPLWLELGEEALSLLPAALRAVSR